MASLDRSLEVATLAAREEERVKLDTQAEAHARQLAEAAARLAAAEVAARGAAEAGDAAREEAAETRDRLVATEEGLLHARAAGAGRRARRSLCMPATQYEHTRLPHNMNTRLPP